jgi:hypothetical protein
MFFLVLQAIHCPAMSKREDAARAAEGVLEPGEIVEVASFATIGGPQTGKTLAVAAVSAIATAGLVSVLTSPKLMPIVLTSKRLLVLGYKGIVVEQPDSKIVAQLLRSEIRAKPARRVMLYRRLDVTDVEGWPVARMNFSLFDHGDARRISDGLGLAPSPAVPQKN